MTLADEVIYELLYHCGVLEATLLRLATQLEEALPWAGRHPAI